MVEIFSGMVGARRGRLKSPVRIRLVGVFVVVLAPETLDTARRIDELLLPSEEGMAAGADFDVDVLHGGRRFDDVSAVARDFSLLVSGMNLVLHG
jgi:hypothetical protein